MLKSHSFVILGQILEASLKNSLLYKIKVNLKIFMKRNLKVVINHRFDLKNLFNITYLKQVFHDKFWHQIQALKVIY